MWVEKVREKAKTTSWISIKQPATEAEIAKLESSLGKVPDDLVCLLKELNGDSYVLLSIDQIIDTNKLLRGTPWIMPVDCLLFFAGNGCGDYYGYHIRRDGECPSDIFLWDHESDNRTWVAGSMDQFITRYCNGEI